MSLNIKNNEIIELVNELSKKISANLTQTLLLALREMKQRLVNQKQAPRLEQRLMEIAEHCASLPVLDTRSNDEILGYNALGTFD